MNYSINNLDQDKIISHLKLRVDRIKLFRTLIALTVLSFAGYWFAEIWLEAKREGSIVELYIDLMFDKYFELEEWLVEKFLGVTLSMLALMAAALFAYHLNNSNLERINKSIKFVQFFVSLPHKFFASLFAFTFGFSVFAFEVDSTAARALLASAIIYLGLPWIVFRYYAKNLSLVDGKILKASALPMSLILGFLCIMISAYLVIQGYYSFVENFEWAKSLFTKYLS